MLNLSEFYRRDLLRGFCLLSGAATLVPACIDASLAASSPSSALTSALASADGLTLNQVTAAQASYLGRQGLAVELTEAVQSKVKSGGLSDGPNFALLDLEFANGVIEVDLAARINGRGQADVRGFVGIAFHVAPDAGTFEAVYLRMTNGSRNTPPPPPPRIDRAVQYFSYPDRPWNKLRQEYPGRYEKSAPISIASWHRLRLEIDGTAVEARIDGEKVLAVDDLSFPNRKGRIGLWVDDGTTGYFANLKATANS
jgi:hypothetical protein